MPSARRNFLAAAGAITLAGCLELNPDDETATETRERQTVERQTLRLERVTADDITPEDPVGSFGPVLTRALTTAVDLVDSESEPVTVGGRIETRGDHHGEAPPVAPFDAVETRGEILAIDGQSAVPYRLDHTADAVDDVPSDAPVIDAADRPQRVAGPIIDVIESGRAAIAGWSAAFQLLDDNAHEGGGYDDMTAYVRHEGEDYRIDRLTGTPEPYAGYAFVVRASRADRAADAVLSPFDPADGVRAELEAAVENGAVDGVASETVAAVEPYDYLLSDYGFFGFRIETVESEGGNG
jgi:hypothetical protein